MSKCAIVPCEQHLNLEAAGLRRGCQFAARKPQLSRLEIRKCSSAGFVSRHHGRCLVQEAAFQDPTKRDPLVSMSDGKICRCKVEDQLQGLSWRLMT